MYINTVIVVFIVNAWLKDEVFPVVLWSCYVMGGWYKNAIFISILNFYMDETHTQHTDSE